MLNNLGVLERINVLANFEHLSGYFKTRHRIRRTPNFRHKHARCVQGFWIAYLRDNT